MALSPTAAGSYTVIIDEILADSDLNTISAKRIRKGLQEAIDHDITAQKDAINDLIMERFDKFQSELEPSPPQETSNGHKPGRADGTSESHGGKPNGAHAASRSRPEQRRDDDQSSDVSEVADDRPPKKKVKRVDQSDDAAFAARLQAEENSRARPTRGGTTRKRPAVKKATPRKKSAKKVGAADDSEVGSGSEDEKPVKRNGAFHKPMNLSAPLSALIGETTLSRPQTVKKIWEYVRAHELQDQSDKRQIQCDDAMRAVFKSERVSMFTMNKILSGHFYPADE